jgi:hypothetical protein
MDISGNTSFNNSNLDNFVLIVENVGKDLTMKKTSNDYILEGVCAVFGAKNNNNRVYEKDEYLPHLSYLQDKIDKGQLVGDLDHPPHFDVTLKSASHIIEALEYDGGDKVNIKLRILNNTPNGKIARALLDGGVNLSISSRAAGQVLESSKVKLHRIFTYDLVGEPGFTEAILRKTLNESLKSDFQMITESYDHLKQSSFVEKEHLVNISESLNFSDNFKIYKINNPIESILESSIQTEKNNKTMADTKDFVTKDSMNRYSEVVKENFESLRAEIRNQKAIFESANSGEGQDLSKLYNFVNYIAEHLEGVINYSDYLSEMVNKNVAYTEHVAETTNHAIEYSSYIGEKLNTSIGHQDYIAEKLNQSINYAEYLKESLNGSIKYQNYLAEELDKGIQYTEYVAEGANNGIQFSEYLSKAINENRAYAQYVAEKTTQGIGYTEYVAEQLNSGNMAPGKRSLLDNVERLTESTSIDNLVASVDAVIAEVSSKSSKAVLENRYPFLKVLSESNRNKFYELDSKVKQSIVETLGAAIWFNENDVLGIMEAVLNESTKELHIIEKFMPDTYKPVWNKMNESEKGRIFAKSQLYNLKTPYQVKSFFDEQDFRGINERVEIEAQNIKEMQKLNESQGTEGFISVERVVESSRGYTSNYLASLQRRANN